MRGNHAKGKMEVPKHPRPMLSVPIDLPSFALNNLSVSAFNFAYYNKQQQKEKKVLQHYNPFFYPLDAVHSWNRIYGKRGFLQFQCVVPSEAGHSAIREMLNLIVSSKKASFLAVIKEFGDIESPGMLSFPRKGVTLCLDFPCDSTTIKLFDQLNQLTFSSGGALYPAKDATMTPLQFAQFYPRADEFQRFIDPKFSSSFWRRVRGTSAGPGTQI